MAKEMAFDEAVTYIKSSKGNAFAFVPQYRNNQISGGQIWVLEYNEEYERDPEDNYEYHLYPSSMTMLPPASSAARASGGTTQVASYSSMISGPSLAPARSERRRTRVSTQPRSGPK